MFELPIDTFERPITGPIYTDEYLEFWGEIYLDNGWLRARGVLFWAFLVDPVAVLSALAVPVHQFVERLLLEQREVRERLDFRDAVGETPCEARALEGLEQLGARCENGRFVEKLRHHRARS
jgi:hypothetical protein